MPSGNPPAKTGSTTPIRPAKAGKAAPMQIRMPARRDGGRGSTVADAIHRDLRAEIVSLRRKPGEPIVEKQIAEAYGVSRTPVREALLRLADDGLIEIFPQSGTFVARILLGSGRFNVGLGVVMTAQGVGAALSTTLAGFVAQYAGYPAAFLTLGGVALVAAAAYLAGGAPGGEAAARPAVPPGAKFAA